ncbi:hypothetical protein [Halorussus pelagicus]|uniref:hypothetical protein n=1 Tax=Halorussus pelagicus TaxID=2505977 RepID=UPI000FFB8A1E|nr:hypothetical protein [Halorussus pelagicus]
MIDKITYATNEILKNGDDPYWWRQRFTSRIAGPMLGKIHGNHGEDFMEKDWDNLLILDACRADMFEQAIDTSQFDEYDSVHSVGCSSPEWMKNTFTAREFPDTVYVTANPWISKIAPYSFHDVENLWITEHDASREDLSSAGVLEEAGLGDVPTIYPDTLSDVARRVHEQYPEKRLIVHYFQPHAPCVGNADGTRKDQIRDEMHPGVDLKNGSVTRQEVWNEYIQNLLYAFQYADELADDLGGKSVFTADHGELFGERLWPFPIRGYAHPDGVRHPKLTEVPWAVKTVGDRRKIVSGDVEMHEADEDEIDDRLRNLGYKV